jgi:hypothetical protein
LPKIEISSETFARLKFAARISGCTEGEIVDRLVGDEGAPQKAPTAREPRPEPRPREVAVHVVYRGERVEGFFDPVTTIVRIASGPTRLENRAFRSPSQAAIEVVQTLNPTRERPETNGWKFWVVTETGRTIQSIREAGR